MRVHICGEALRALACEHVYSTDSFRYPKLETGLCLYRSSMGTGQNGAASAGMADRNSHRPNGTVNGNSSQYVI